MERTFETLQTQVSGGRNPEWAVLCLVVCDDAFYQQILLSWIYTQTSTYMLFKSLSESFSTSCPKPA